MTHNNLLTLLRAQANRNASDAASTTLLRLSIRMAIGQASRRKPSTHETNFRITVVADQIGYALPTTNIAGTTIKLVAFDTMAFRAKGVKGIPFEAASEIDKEAPEWLDSAEVTSGTVEALSYTENEIKAFRPASASFKTANPYIYGRGWRSIKKPYEDGTTVVAGDVAWTAEIDFPFDDWHEGFLHGSLYWTFLNARMPDEAAKINERSWKPFLEELEGLTVAQGIGVEQISPAGQFTDSDSEGPDDYGRRWDY